MVGLFWFALTLLRFDAFYHPDTGRLNLEDTWEDVLCLTLCEFGWGVILKVHQ
jgi:hypothetical protein